MKIEKFASDSALAVEGIWEDIDEGLKLRVARMNNPRYREYLRKLSRTKVRVGRRMQGGMGIDDMLEMQKKAVAKHILIDWEGLEDANGESIQHSEEKALELFESHPDLYELIIEIANDVDLFREDQRKDAEENL